MAGAHRLKSSDEVLAAVADAFSHEGRVAIALSGGGDSAVAAWAITQLAGPDRVRAIHVHHGLASSDDMAGAADAVAAHVGIGLTRLDVVVPDGASFEGKARDVRLAAIENALDDDEIVVTGHHAGDVAETVIGNLLRGAGATGLGGIASRRGVWHRPLVGVPAALVADAAAELGIPFVDDPENTDLRHTRNVIRHRVLPLVEEFAGSAVERVIGRSADALRADDTELERLLEGFTVGESAGAAVAGAALLATLPGPLAARAARRLLREAHPPYPGSSDDVASLLSVARGDTHRVSLSGGYVASREGPHVAVYIDAPAPSDPTRLEPGGSARFGAWVLSLVAVGGKPPVRLGRSRVIAADPGGEVIVRAAEPGERIDIGTGSKLVRDAMAEAGVPERLRPAWPVVTAGAKMMWLPGARLADWARLRPDDDRAAIELAVEGTGV